MRLLLLCLILAAPRAQDDVARLLEQLADNSPVAREEAAKKLIDAYPASKPGLEAALARTADPDLQAQIRTVLADGRRRELRQAAEAVLPERIRKAYPDLAAWLFERDPARRKAAFGALQQTSHAHPPGSAFVGLFLSPREFDRLLPSLRAAAAEAEPAVRMEWVRTMAVHEPRRFGPAWRDAVRERYDDPDPDVRSLAREKLSYGNVPGGNVDYFRDWDKVDGPTRLRILREAARLQVPDAARLLGRELENPERLPIAAGIVFEMKVESLRPRALELLRASPAGAALPGALRHASPEDATGVLVPALRASQGAEEQILQALAQKGTAQAGDAVAPFLGHSDGRVSRAALQALDRCGSPRHAAAVARALRSELVNPTSRFVSDKLYWDLLVRWKAGEELGELMDLGPKVNPNSVDLPRVLRALRPAGAGKKLAPFLRSSDLGEVKRTLELLAAAGATEEARANLDVLRGLVSKKDLLDSLLAAAGELKLRELLPLLLEHLDEVHPIAAGRALAGFWTLEERRAALRDPDPKVRAGAALASIGGDSATLLQIAREPDPAVRRRVATALGEARDEPSVLALVALMKDPDPAVAAAAADAFQRGNRLPMPEETLLELLKSPALEVRILAAMLSPRDLVRARPELFRPLFRDPATARRLESYGRCDPDLMEKVFATLGRSTVTDEVSMALFLAGDSGTPEERGKALLLFFERWLATDQRPGAGGELGSERHSFPSLFERAAWDAPRSQGTDLEPVLFKMLASDKADLQDGAAKVAASLGLRRAIPRLTELARAPGGLAAAEALGSFHALPKELLLHEDLKVAANAVRAAAIQKDPALFDALLSAAERLDLEEFRIALETLVRITPRDQGVRILGLARRCHEEDRRRVFSQLREVCWPELVEPASEYLDDLPGVAMAAGELMMEAGDRRHGEAVFRSNPYEPSRAIVHYGLQGRSDELLRQLGEDGRAVHAAWAIVALGLREHAAAVVVRQRTAPFYPDRISMLVAAARLGGAEAVLSELRGGDPGVRIAAAQAIWSIGPGDYQEEIRRIAAEQPRKALQLALALGDREIVARAWHEDAWDVIGLAAAERLEVPGAREALRKRFREDPSLTLVLAGRAWEPAQWTEIEDMTNWRYWSVRATLEKLSRRMGREVVLGSPVPEGFLDRFVAYGTMLSLLHSMPWKAAFYIDAKGRAVIDTEERSLAGWRERLEK